MNNTEILINQGQKYVMNTYKRLPIILVKGEGSRVWNAEGIEYLDFVGGLAVNSLGHCHPKISEALIKQATTLLHVSNLYWNEPQVKLAKLLVENSCMDKVFFANSGAEANEAAIKLARKFSAWESKYEIITMTKSFHGRTLATLKATGQEKFHQDFNPLPEGFRYSPFNDLEALKEIITPLTCAIMLEPIQGEGGVNVASQEFLQGVRKLCDEKGLLLIFDEVQVGIGRTGTMFAYEQYGVNPDIITLAKALGGGVPIGAIMASDKVASSYKPGDHATTFGGNPLVSTVALAMINAILEEDVLKNTKAMSKLAFSMLGVMKEKYPIIKEIRGKGLIIGVELAIPGNCVVAKCQKKGLLVNCTSGNVIRLLPPLNISKSDMKEALDIFELVLKEMNEKV